MFLNAIIEKDKNGYFAYIPELKGCVSQGHTYEEAVINIKESLSLYIESLNHDELDTLNNKIVSIVPLEVPINA